MEMCFEESRVELLFEKCNDSTWLKCSSGKKILSISPTLHHFAALYQHRPNKDRLRMKRQAEQAWKGFQHTINHTKSSMLTWLDPVVMSLRFIAILSICAEYSRSMKCTKFTGPEVPSDRLTSLDSDEWQRQAWVVSNVSAEGTRDEGPGMQKHAVMRNMAVHFYRRNGIPGRHHSSTAVKKKRCWMTPGDFAWSASSRSVIFHEREWKWVRLSQENVREGK